MALMDEATWRGQIYSGGWTAGAFGPVAPVPGLERHRDDR
jgi:hypothetical protein